MLSVLTQFLCNRLQEVMMDGCRNKLVKVVSGEPRVSGWAPQLFLLYTVGLISLIENKLSGYADDSTLVAVVRESVAVTESMNLELNRVCMWCDLRGHNNDVNLFLLIKRKIL